MACADPDQVELCPRPVPRCRRSWIRRTSYSSTRRPGQVGQRLDQRIAVDLQPQRGVDLGRRRRGTRALTRCGAAPRPRGRRRACPPAASGSSRLRRVGGQLLDAPAHRGRLVAHDGLETLACRRVEIGVVEQLDRRLQVAERRPAAFGQLVQQRSRADSSAKSRVMLSSISTKPFSAASDGVSEPPVIAHRRHLHPQQLPAARAGDELRRRVLAAPRCRRCCTLSSACATSLRSNTA